jgi:hypothetical protein
MLGEDEHVYYWAWAEDDNKGISYFESNYKRKFRVFRLTPKMGTKDEPITEAMSKAEAIEYCQRIVKLTGGREI